MNKPITTKRVIWTSFFVDALDVAMNVAVAVITGSVVMLAEALQGLADLASVGMLLVGFQRSKKRSTKLHPFGYGKEQYFWALIAAFLIISVAASLSVYFGIQKFLHPDKLEFLTLAYAALIIAVFSNGYALWLSIRKLLGDLPLKTLPKVFVRSSDMAPKTTVVLDVTGTLAAIFGLIALAVYGLTDNARFDGLGAILIGVLLLLLALVLLFTTKGLVTGKSASDEVELAITNATKQIPQVKDVLDLRSMMLGSDSLLVNIEVHLRDDLSTDEVEEVIDEIKESVKKSTPGRVHVNVEPETPSKPRPTR